MQDNLFNTHRGSITRVKSLPIILASFVLVLISFTNGSAADKAASNKQPLSFGTGANDHRFAESRLGTPQG